MTTIRPTDEEARHSFETYLSYLGNLGRWLRDLYGAAVYPQLIVAMRQLTGVRRIQRHHTTMSEDIAKSLRIAWVNEFQLHMVGAYGADLLPALLHGTAHGGYYAIYHGARAYFGASRQTVSNTHADALGALSNTIRQRRIFALPWSVWCHGGPSREAMTLGGGPPNDSDTSVAFRSLEKSLYTTRERQIAQKKAEVREREQRERIGADKAADIAMSLPATTLFDFMWRLRTRSDYRGAESFLEGISVIDYATSYHRSISTFTSATLAALELLVIAYVGLNLYESAAQSFLRQTNGLDSPLQERLNALTGRT